MTHYSSVRPETSLAGQITNVDNVDGESAYDLPQVLGLLDPAQDEQEALTKLNADSYAWMSLDSNISQICGEGYDWPKQLFYSGSTTVPSGGDRGSIEISQ